MSIPTTLRVPFVYVEFDPSRAFQGPSLLPYKVLLIGGRTSAGSKAALSIDRVTNESQARDYYGAGSILHLLFASFIRNNRITEVWGIPLEDDGAGVAATKTLTVTGPATADGVVYVYVNGERVAVPVLSGDTQNAIAAAISAALVLETDLPYTFGVATNVVTATAKNDGETGNDIDVRLNYGQGESFPAGVSVAVAAGVSGAVNPDIQDAIDAIGDEWYQVFSAPYYDAANLTAIEDELDTRFGPTKMIDGTYFTSRRGSLSALQTFGDGRNSQHVVILHNTGCPTSPWQMAAAVAGQAALEGSIDPARPFQTLELKGILPPVVQDRFTLEENSSLLYDGISTFSVDQAGKVRIQRLITTYQRNAQGAEDIAYLDYTTLATLRYLRYDFRNQLQTKYARAKLADDGVLVPPGQQIITPQIAKAEAVAIFRGWQALGLVENVDQFKNDLTVVRNISDPNRLDFVLPPDLINQFMIAGVSIQFLLESPQ